MSERYSSPAYCTFGLNPADPELAQLTHVVLRACAGLYDYVPGLYLSISLVQTLQVLVLPRGSDAAQPTRAQGVRTPQKTVETALDIPCNLFQAVPG